LRDGLCTHPVLSGFSIGRIIFDGSQPAKTLVIGYYGLGGCFVKPKKTAAFPAVQTLEMQRVAKTVDFRLKMGE
jgi:hypothetical protein